MGEEEQPRSSGKHAGRSRKRRPQPAWATITAVLTCVTAVLSLAAALLAVIHAL